MEDKITLERIKEIHPLLQVELGEIYADICEALKGKAICRFAYVYRSFEQQNGLYAIGRTKGKKGAVVTNAKGGESYHNYRMAVDIVLLKDKDGNGTFETASWETNIDFDGDGAFDWLEVVKIFKQYGWEWGGDWKFNDKPHFQKTLGLSIKQLQRMHAAQGNPAIIQIN